jgi:hypothetical protein
VKRGEDGDEMKAAAKEWVSWINHLDLFDRFFGWVLEGGIKLMARR